MAVDRALMPSMTGGQSMDVAITPEESIVVELPDGGMEINLSPEPLPAANHNDNLAEFISDNTLMNIGSELSTLFDADKDSRKEWETTYIKGLDLLGLKIEDRTQPWEGACGVFHPLLSEALVKFQSETMMSTFPASGPVRTQIIGRETPEKKESAQRVQEDMNYQLMDVMKEYRPEHERMLWGLGLSGNAFKKVYYDPSLERQVSIFVPAEDIVVPYGASDLESAERVTHVMRKTENELRRLQVSGFYRDVDLGPPDNVLDEVEKKIAEKLGFKASTDTRYKILEMHVEIDLIGHEHRDEKGELTGIALSIRSTYYQPPLGIYLSNTLS